MQSTSSRPCRGCRIRKVACRRILPDDPRCEACAKKGIACLEQEPAKRTRVRTGKRVEEARRLTALSEPLAYQSSFPCPPPSASTSALITRPSASSGQLPISPARAIILSHLYLTSLTPSLAGYSAWRELLESSEAAQWQYEHLSRKDQVLTFVAAAYAARVHPEMAQEDSVVITGPEISDSIVASAIKLAQDSGYFLNPSKSSIVALTAIATILHDQDFCCTANRQTLSVMMTCFAHFDSVAGSSEECLLLMPRLALNAVRRRKPQMFSKAYFNAYFEADYGLVLESGLPRYRASNPGFIHLGHVTLDLVYCCYLITEEIFGRDQETQERAIRDLWNSYDASIALLRQAIPRSEDDRQDFSFASFGLSMMITESYFLEAVHEVIPPTSHQLLAQSKSRVQNCQQELFKAMKVVRGYYEQRKRNIHLSQGVGIFREHVARVVFAILEDEQIAMQNFQWTTEMFASMAMIWPDFQPHYDKILAKFGRPTVVNPPLSIDFNSFMDLTTPFPFDISHSPDVFVT